MDNIQIIVGGAAGEGSKKAGLFIAKLFNAHGYRIFIHEDYQSVIKGGHNFSYISATQDKHDTVREGINFVLALNKEAVFKHAPHLFPEGVLLYDEGIVDTVEEVVREDVEVVAAPLQGIVNEAEGIPLMKNTALVATFAKTVGISWEKLEEALRREIKKETEKNLQVARVAYDKVPTLRQVHVTEREPLPLLSGHEAVAVGAIDAGLECYFAYPMTPSTGVLAFLSGVEGVKVFQPENEIAVINAGVGASYAGRRTMIGTSGGGFALMTEGVSLAAQAETPLVTVLSQRMGPASGVPTYQAQGDLLFALNSGHGDVVRFVVAPGDVDEAYLWGGEALNIAWEYQLPAIIMLDKELSENRYEFTLEKERPVQKREGLMSSEKENYQRYEGEDVSPMKFPGEEGVVVKGTSYEHTPKGVATEEPGEIVAMQDKRNRKHEKLEQVVGNMEAVKSYQEGELAVIFWGSTKGAVLEAIKDLPVKAVQIIVCQPFPKEQLQKALEGAKKIVCVENNSTGQMAQVLAGQQVSLDESILRYDGRPFSAEDLREKIKSLL